MQAQGAQAHFSDAESRFPAAAEVAHLPISRRYSFTETLAVEEFQLLPQKRGGDGLLLSARHRAPVPAVLWPH